MNVSIEVQNLSELQRLYSMEPTIAGEEIQRAIKSAANTLLRNTIKEEPIDTGKLRQSTHAEINQGEAIIRPAVDYAWHVHQGSPAVEGKLMAIEAAAISPRARAKLPPANKKGMIFFTKRKAIPPNPFLERAADRSQEKLTDIFANAAQRIRERLATK